MSFTLQPVGSFHTLVKGNKQYDFQPQPEHDIVAITIMASRMTIRKEVSTAEAREQWQRLLEQGYQQW